MENFNNPAGRLLFWLRQAEPRPANENAETAWCAIFGLDQQNFRDRLECMRRAASVAALASETRVMALQLPPSVHPNLLMKNFGEVDEVVARFPGLPHIPMQHFMQGLGGTGWHALEMLSAMLGTHLPEKVLDEEQRPDLIQRVRDLVDAVIATDDLTEEVKTVIIQRLRDAEDALVNVHIYASARVESATDALLGAALVRGGANWLREKPTGKQLGALITALALALGMAANVKTLLPGNDDTEPPAIEQTTDVHVDVDLDNNSWL